MRSLKDNWLDVLNILEKEVTAVSFDLWIKTLDPFEIKDDEVVLIASSQIAKNQCLKNHSESLSRAIEEVFDNISSFKILDPNEKEEHDKAISLEKQINTNISSKINKNIGVFNNKYTFNNFVVGKSNQFVYAAASAVAENPSSRYNPLFIYGGVGLGKTHLLHSIGNYLKIAKPELNVLYVTCEQFTNDYIYAIRGTDKDKSIINFRDKYRNLDVLMIDDMQFITNKLETQEEFFNTFNDLYQNNKQIVIACDRHPREIATLSDRLRSRFTSGLIQDVQTPNFETRIAILKKKAQQENYNVDEEVITFLAENIDTNIREMEGLLSKVVFYASLTGKHVAGMEDANEALKDKLQTDMSSVTSDKIIDNVCKYYHIEKSAVIGKKRNKEIVEARQVSIYLITELMDLPLVSIGKTFGGRDHTTVIHSRDKITDAIKTNNRIKVIVNDIKNMVLKK